MENSPDDEPCCVICLKTSNDSQLISIEANTAGDINKLLKKLYNIEIANAGSEHLRICITCLFIIERAASFKDCLQNHGKFFTSTLEKIQAPPNHCPGCLKATQSELQPLESASSVENSEQRDELPNRIDHVKRERVDDGAAVFSIKAEVSDDDISMPSEGDETSSSSTADLNPSVKSDRGDAKTSAENVDFEWLLASTDLKKEVDHAPEIKLGKVDALDDFMNYNVVEDLKSEGSSKEVIQAGVQQSEGTLGSDLTCHCGFKVVSAEGFSTHQKMNVCKSEILQVRNAPTYNEPMLSVPILNLLESEVKWESETEMDDDEDCGSDSSTDEDDDDDASPDYVANSVAGGSTSRYSMRTRRRSRPQEGSAVDITAHRLNDCDKKFECDHCSKVFDMKKGISAHMRVHINYQQPYSCDRAGCTKSYSSKACLDRHQRNCYSDRFKKEVTSEDEERSTDDSNADSSDSDGEPGVVQATASNFNQLRDDLELTDQRVIPKGKLISTLVDQKYFADFIKVLEFLHSFPEVLSISDKFPSGITVEILKRAMIMKEVNGPLSDILQVLLGTIFSMQVEEENEVVVEYRINGGVPENHSKYDQMKNASRAHIWSAQHHSTKINKMVIDSTTITELLRLHLMGSGAIVSERTSKYRIETRGGYKSQDDPGLILAAKYPHIIEFMSQYSVFQLSTKDIFRILGCLIDQILTYSNIREVIEDRIENAAAAKLEYKNLKQLDGRRERKIVEEKKLLQEEHKTFVASFAEEPQAKRVSLTEKAEEELEGKIAQIDAQSVKDRNQHLTYLGCDRAFRNYYIFESLPGLFVEHDITYAGTCLDRYIKNNPALAHCTHQQRYGIIKQMVADEEAGASDDKEIKVENKGAAHLQDKTVESGKKEIDNEMQKDLFMCNCDPATCIVHSNTPERNNWIYYNTAEEIDALIESLNVRGYREKNLREYLEASRDTIVNLIKKCPVAKLSVLIDEDEKADEMKKIVRRMTKKYENANLNREPGTDPNEIYDLTLREIILEFEQKLTMGCLAKLNVQDRIQRRKSIEDIEFCAPDDNLKWGNAGKHNGFSNGDAKENGSAHGNEGMDEDTASSVGDLEPHTFDSGNCSDMEVDDVEEGKMKTSKMESVKLRVKNLAMALLQIEQGIDIKFIRAPFEPTKKLKDKHAMVKAIKKKILKWEESLMMSTSYSQVFLHYNILHDSILWSRSAQRVECMICRRTSDPEKTLLCDECNKGWHMFCLKPKLTVIPKGDWFCPRCRPDDYKPGTRNLRQKFVGEVVEEVVSDDDEDRTADDSTADSATDGDSEPDVCMVCRYEGDKLCRCKHCDVQCHPECAKPPVKRSRIKDWICWKCTSAQQRSERIKRRRMDEDEGENEQPLKMRKVEKPTGRQSKASTEVKIQQAEEPQASTSMAANQYKESTDIVQPMSSFSTVSETSKSKRKFLGKFVCCKEDFATSENKLKHMETAHADRKQVCGDCGQIFYQTYQFNSHMKDHNNIRRFRCTFEGCIKSYDSVSVLALHKRQIHADYRLKCFCGLRASSKPALMKHQQKCTVGDSQKINSEKQAQGQSSAEQKIQAKAERKVELPRFGCDFQGCDESFVTSAELNQHALGHSENSDRVETLPSSTVKASPTYECGCSFKTQDLGDFKKHYEVPCPR